MNSEYLNAKGTYVHYKNRQRYEAVGIALQTETEEKLVIYKPLYKNDYELFARPYDMFFGDVEFEGKMVKRFQKITV